MIESKSTKYSEKVLDHFRNPRNVGTLEGDDVAVGKVGNPTCGDIMEVYIRIDGEKITDAKFRTFGCGSAIATTSMTTEMVVGMQRGHLSGWWFRPRCTSGPFFGLQSLSWCWASFFGR